MKSFQGKQRGDEKGKGASITLVPKTLIEGLEKVKWEYTSFYIEVLNIKTLDIDSRNNEPRVGKPGVFVANRLGFTSLR